MVSRSFDKVAGACNLAVASLPTSFAAITRRQTVRIPQRVGLDVRFELITLRSKYEEETGN